MTTMAAIIQACLLGAALTAGVCPEPALKRFQSTQLHMGVPFKIVLYAADRESANRALAAAFRRVEQLNRRLSDYDPRSELSRLGAASPTEKPVPVSRDLFNVLQHAQTLSAKTDGAFDVTVGPLTKLWRRARRQKKMPPAKLFAKAKEAVGYQNVRLDAARRTVELLRENMRLDLGGIAKGYAADQALAELRKQGIHRALVDASGDMAIGDSPPGESGWKIGIAPLQPKASPSRFLRLAHCAIATSGDAWQYVEIDGRRYSHILDPRSGLGLTSRSSVTVIAADCITSDALASAVSVLGPTAGIKLVEETPRAAALIVRATGDKTETFSSNRFRLLRSDRP